MRLYQNFFKRIFDLAISIIVFFFLSPVFLISTLLLVIINKGTPFFLQLRPGKDNRIFKVIKFKTMNDDKDSTGLLLSDERRLTPVGKFIRRTSIDEIPQLLNVIKGDMSLVGPRPLLVEYLSLYNQYQRRRHNVRPGITGWAQVNGRNAISWEKKFEYDIWYVDHINLSLDIKILCMTLIKVFKSEDVTAANHVTTGKFKGSLR